MKKLNKLWFFFILLASVWFIPMYPSAATIRLNTKSLTIVNPEQNGFGAADQYTKLKVLGTKKKAAWSSKDSKIATVTKNGRVIAKKEGTTYITAKVGKKSFSCKVTVLPVILRQKMKSNSVFRAIKMKRKPYLYKNVAFEFHGATNFMIHHAYDNWVHGWYWNYNTKSTYECIYWVHGKKITAFPVDNNYKGPNGLNKPLLRGCANFYGNAEFEIVSNTSTKLKIKSINNNYKDKGRIYTFPKMKKAPNLKYPESDKPVVKNPVVPLSSYRKSKKASEAGIYSYFMTYLPKENPLSYFYTYVNSKNLRLVIQGCYIEDSMGQNDLAHGWYENDETNTAYECYYRLSGSRIIAERVANGRETNFKGNAEFVIVSDDTDKLVIRSANNNYGDLNREYTLIKQTEYAEKPNSP